MNKLEIAGCVAERTGLSRSAAGNAVDAVFEAVGEALAKDEEVRDRRLRNLRHQEPARPYGAQSEDWREPGDTRLDRAYVQARQDAEGFP